MRDPGAGPPKDDAGSPARVAALLASRSEAVLRAWEQRVRSDRSVPEARRLGTLALRDHVPALLEELVEALEQKESRRVTAEAIGRQVWHSPESQIHAEQRFESGYSLGEVLRELSHLRVTLFDLICAEGLRPERDATKIIETAIDEAMTVAATELERVAHVELVASEIRYRTLVDSVRDYAIFMLDASGRVASWNPGALRIIGYDEREIVGQPVDVMYLPADRDAGAPARELGQARAEGRYLCRHLRVRKDGSAFWADVTLTTVHDGEGRIVGFSNVTRDVTAQVAAEQALQASEQRVSAILRTTMDAIITADASHRIVVFNESAQRTFRCPASEALGSPLERFIPQRFRGTHAEQMQRFAQTGSTSRAMGRLGRIAALRADGEEFPIEATISQAEVGGAPLFTIVLRDVSEQARLEALREQAEARLRGVLEHTTALVYLKDEAGRYVLANPALEQMLGRPVADIVGRTDDELFPPELAARYRENDRVAREVGEPLEVTEVASLPDGLHTYLSIKFPMEIRGARLLGGISTDITTRVRVQAELAREIELRELFMAVLAHDLRTPLSAVTMSAGAILARDDVAADVAKGVLRIRNGARRMATMIEQLLEVSQVRSGRSIQVERAPCDLGRIAADVVAELRDAHPDRVLELAVSGDARGDWDASKLARVVANLGSNAVVHGRAGAPVHLAVTGHDGVVALEVVNANAAGPIPPELQQRIFDPFARAASAGEGGLGLGLYIVDQVVRGHGGRITVQSDDTTTRFLVTLPRS